MVLSFRGRCDDYRRGYTKHIVWRRRLDLGDSTGPENIVPPDSMGCRALSENELSGGRQYSASSPRRRVPSALLSLQHFIVCMLSSFLYSFLFFYRLFCSLVHRERIFEHLLVRREPGVETGVSSVQNDVYQGSSL